MTLVRDINLSACDTGLVRGLSLQIIAEINLIVPGVLANFSDLDVEIAGPQVNPFMQPAANEALRLAIAAQPDSTLRITSAYRTVAQQLLLRRQFERRMCHITAAALPGRSNHENGLAIDVANFEEWKDTLQAHNWQWFGSADRVHFTFMGAGTLSGLGSIGIRGFQRLWNRNNTEDPIQDDGAFGPQTQARLDASPAEGFGIPRLLRLIDPNLTGDDVTSLQQALDQAGFAVEATGVFDADTDAAVRSFQDQNGLAVDGVVGPMTLQALGLL